MSKQYTTIDIPVMPPSASATYKFWMKRQYRKSRKWNARRKNKRIDCIFNMWAKKAAEMEKDKNHGSITNN